MTVVTEREKTVEVEGTAAAIERGRIVETGRGTEAGKRRGKTARIGAGATADRGMQAKIGADLGAKLERKMNK